ncbi:hypothetical protein KGQ20_17100 [Catenulispora sp. NF23]|uniref:hypothetical protein n=1 Tax=Catenulispora pinistramenti TaxID=2705254 RepID=UPI001BAD3958|nr:hypothetical protein [Catenulispora pinistramenti]MBS2534491.1 hypothetical protein [Catenulispora pinistramenti]
MAQFYDPAGTAIPQNPAPRPGPGQVLMDGRSGAEIFKSLLPSGLVTANYTGQDHYDPANPGVAVGSTMTVDDGTGKLTDVAVTLTQNVARALKITDCVSAKEMAAVSISDCRAVAEPDGSVVLSYRMDEYNPDGAGFAGKGSYDDRVIRVFQNGTVLIMSASNFHIPPNPPQTKGWHVDPVRQAPLLSLDQLAGIAMSPQWGLTVPAQLAQQAKQDLVPYDDQTPH